MRFAPDFAWGVASSAFQAEGGDVPNDWVDAARAGRVPPNPGNGFWSAPRRTSRSSPPSACDTTASPSSGAASSPSAGRFDEAALDRYRAICDAARAAGVTPWVNFFHFTHPRWFAARGGFLEPGEPRRLPALPRARRRARCAPHARHFHVSNESMVYVLAGYLIGAIPPFVRDARGGLGDDAHTCSSCTPTATGS